MTVVALLEELISLAAKEAKSVGQFVIPGLGKAVKSKSQSSHGSQSPDR